MVSTESNNSNNTHTQKSCFNAFINGIGYKWDWISHPPLLLAMAYVDGSFLETPKISVDSLIQNYPS
jgi:hypothetical protein